MRKTLKAIIFTFALSLILFMLSVTALADVMVRVVDNENILTTSEESILESRIATVREEYQYDLVIVTTSSFGTKTAKQYAENYYDNSGYGCGTNDTGILLLISKTKGEYYICATGDAVDALGVFNFNTLEDNVVERLSDRDFYGAATAFVDTCENIIIKESNNASNPSSKLLPAIIIVLIISVAVGIISVLVMKSKMNNAKPQKHAGQYVKYGSFRLVNSTDVFLYSTVTRTLRPQNRSSSSGGGSRSGRGGRF